MKLRIGPDQEMLLIDGKKYRVVDVGGTERIGDIVTAENSKQWGGWVLHGELYTSKFGSSITVVEEVEDEDWS